jgi:hypothetical protein
MIGEKAKVRDWAVTASACRNEFRNENRDGSRLFLVLKIDDCLADPTVSYFRIFVFWPEDGTPERASRHRASRRLGTIHNVVQVVMMVKALATDEDGNEIYPYKWNCAFAQVPFVETQHRPMFDGSAITRLISAARGRAE